jgi:hypothetical protein
MKDNCILINTRLDMQLERRRISHITRQAEGFTTFELTTVCESVFGMLGQEMNRA